MQRIHMYRGTFKPYSTFVIEYPTEEMLLLGAAQVKLAAYAYVICWYRFHWHFWFTKCIMSSDLSSLNK